MTWRKRRKKPKNWQRHRPETWEGRKACFSPLPHPTNIRNLEDLKTEALRLFPMATENALERPGIKNPALGTLRALCWEHFKELGFACMADCFAAIVPRICGRVSLDAWSSAQITVAPWTFRLECRPFWIGSDQVHLTIHHDSPLPGVTETGYRCDIPAHGRICRGDHARGTHCRDVPAGSTACLILTEWGGVNAPVTSPAAFAPGKQVRRLPRRGRTGVSRAVGKAVPSFPTPHPTFPGVISRRHIPKAMHRHKTPIPSGNLA